MRQVNARVVECGQPRLAIYMGTHNSRTKHYMEIRYWKRQCRKWVSADKVTLHDGVELIFIEKVGELATGNKV